MFIAVPKACLSGGFGRILKICGLFQSMLVLLFFRHAGGSVEYIQQLTWCAETYSGIDWNIFRELAQSDECYEPEEENAVLRTECRPAAVALCAEASRFLVQASDHSYFPCANGQVFVLAVTLVYAPQAIPPRDIGRARALLWAALQKSFLLDTGPWPVKTYDALNLFDHQPASYTFHALEGNPHIDSVTIVIPRCPRSLAVAIEASFPTMPVIAGLREEASTSVPSHWNRHRNAWARPVGELLNTMLREVESTYVLVIVGAGVPKSPDDIAGMIRVLSQRSLVAVGGPIIDSEMVYADFCHRLRPRQWRLSFDKTYDYSITFNESSKASVRGYWFHESALDADGPCKVCETLPPTFLARSDALASMLPFHPDLDGEWVLLDYFLKASRTPLVGGLESATPDKPGWRDAPPRFAVCPFIGIREVEELGGPHLYGRSDLSPGGVSPSEPWFGNDSADLGPVLGESLLGPLQPDVQSQLFMDVNNLKIYEGIDGITRRFASHRHFGCSLTGVNCAVPQWIYRGWAVPPCCKETMRHLLFYIDDVFRELGIRYIVTDGVLLGSYKFGGMLDWDADVDLHIHDDDFDRLEGEVKPRVDGDGYFLRKHVNNVSFLLQANEENYLLIELNKRREPWNKSTVWWVPIEGRLFPAMEYAHINLSAWYGFSFFEHRLRHVPDWEEASRPMYCGTPYHHNCLDEIPSGKDCKLMQRC